MSAERREKESAGPDAPRAALVRRLTDLEFHLAHQQRICDQLNEVATEQAQRIDRLERALVRMEKQLKEIRDAPRDAFDPLDERPPHY